MSEWRDRLRPCIQAIVKERGSRSAARVIGVSHTTVLRWARGSQTPKGLYLRAVRYLIRSAGSNGMEVT